MDCEAKKVDFPENLAKQFGRLLQKIDALWGSPAAVQYLDELIMPTRNKRQGFPVEIALELTALKQLHEFTYPPRGLNNFDPYHLVHRDRFKEGTCALCRDCAGGGQSRGEAPHVRLQVLDREQRQPVSPEIADFQPVSFEGVEPEHRHIVHRAFFRRRRRGDAGRCGTVAGHAARPDCTNKS